MRWYLELIVGIILLVIAVCWLMGLVVLNGIGNAIVDAPDNTYCYYQNDPPVEKRNVGEPCICSEKDKDDKCAKGTVVKSEDDDQKKVCGDCPFVESKNMFPLINYIPVVCFGIGGLYFVFRGLYTKFSTGVDASGPTVSPSGQI